LDGTTWGALGSVYYTERNNGDGVYIGGGYIMNIREKDSSPKVFLSHHQTVSCSIPFNDIILYSPARIAETANLLNH
jgi:hypothetical protein